MNNKVIAILILISWVCLLSSARSYAVSGSVQSQDDYIFTLTHLRNMRIVIENFGTDELKTHFDKVSQLFQRNAKEFYAQEFSFFDEESKKYRTRFFYVKKEMSTLFDKMANIYLERGKEILDSTTKQSFDILISYGRQSNLVKFFNKEFDPLNDIKPYKEKEYHFFHDKEIIERYLRHGYKTLNNAKRIYTDPDLLLIKNKEKKTSKDYSYLINRYWRVISDCRQAKQYGIEIHKILKVNEVTTILKRYQKNLVSLDPNPIFDDRIPQEFKVDANDNLKLIHSHELQRISKVKGPSEKPQE